MVGLLYDPGLSAKLADHLTGSLPDRLAERVSDQLEWNVGALPGPVPLDEYGGIPVFDLVREHDPEECPGLLFCLTDLPRHIHSSVYPAVADASLTHGVAVVSLPALGGVRTAGRARDVITYLVGQMAADHLQLAGYPASGDPPARSRTAKLAAPLRHTTFTEGDMDTSLTAAGLRGKARLLAGMVRDNRPWRLVPSLSDAFGAAAAAGSFGLFFSTVWTLADAMPWWQLLLVTSLVLPALVGWLILDNDLWERPFRADREDVVLYNTATLLTLGVGSICGYAMLGSSLEGEDSVQAATFSHREQQRRAQQQQRQHKADQQGPEAQGL